MSHKKVTRGERAQHEEKTMGSGSSAPPLASQGELGHFLDVSNLNFLLINRRL